MDTLYDILQTGHRLIFYAIFSFGICFFLVLFLSSFTILSVSGRTENSPDTQRKQRKTMSQGDEKAPRPPGSSMMEEEQKVENSSIGSNPKPYEWPQDGTPSTEILTLWNEVGNGLDKSQTGKCGHSAREKFSYTLE